MITERSRLTLLIGLYLYINVAAGRGGGGETSGNWESEGKMGLCCHLATTVFSIMTVDPFLTTGIGNEGTFQS